MEVVSPPSTCAGSKLLAVQNIDPGSLTDALRYAGTSWNTARWWTARASPFRVRWIGSFAACPKTGPTVSPRGMFLRRITPPGTRRGRAPGTRALEAERRLLEEEAALALEKEVEAMFRQMLAEPDGPFAAQILEKVPAVLRSRGGLENPLVQKACRMQISYMLQDAVGAGQ
ncbi:MAG: hypothetical protein ACLR7Z_03105 [Bilophila wadsworthia]